MTEHDIEALFWDIGGVILRMDSAREGHRAFVEWLVSEYDTDHPPEQALAQWRETLGEYFNERTGTEFRPGREGYRRAVDAILAEDVPEEDWREQFEQIHAEYGKANSDAIETIDRLAETDLHLGVLSDVDHEEGKRILRGFGVFEQFDSYTTSEEVGRTKPDPAMFETALEKAGVEPTAAMMVGDRYSHDMQGGRRAGLRTVGYGTDAGPAVDYQLQDLRELLDILGVDTG
jgi:putative hydrolase of the HAD superfamily